MVIIIYGRGFLREKTAAEVFSFVKKTFAFFLFAVINADSNIYIYNKIKV